MLLAAEINLFPDATILLQMIIFLVVFFVLNRFVFKPVLNVLQLRKAKTEGDRKKIEEITQKTEELIKEYEGKIKEAKLDAYKIKEMIRLAGAEEGERIVRETRQATLAQIEKVKKEIEEASQRAQKELEREAGTLSKTIAEKVLGRSLRN